MASVFEDRSSALLRGLSDFWIRFFADTTILDAFFNASEIQIAQTYLNILQSFLGISLQDVPLFRKEAFKLLTIREDQIAFQAVANIGASRYVYTLAEALAVIPALQNKVFGPTAALVPGTDYDFDATAYALQFLQDPTGTVGRELGRSDSASLLTYGTGALTQCYVTTGEPFANAKPGHWVRLANSSVGNNGTYLIAKVIDARTVLLSGTFTLPDPNSGLLGAVLLDSDFASIPGFAKRVLTVEIGGSFDDVVRRTTLSEQASWAAEWPTGMGLRKGDILRVLDQEAIPTVPADFTISLLRHDRVYLSTKTPLPVGTGPQLSDSGRICTVNPTTDRVLLTAHGLGRDARIMLITSGGMPGGLTAGQFLYVRDPGVDDFQVAVAPGGVAIDITSSGSGTLMCYAIGSGASPRLVRNYVVLRKPPDTDITNEPVLFTEADLTPPKTGIAGELVLDLTLGPCLHDVAATFAGSERQRFVTISGSGLITCTADFSHGNVLTRTGGMQQPFARSSAGGQVTVTSGAQMGTYAIVSVADDGQSVILDGGPFTPEVGVGVRIEAVTNDGTYRIRRVDPDGKQLILDQLFAYPDVNNGSLSWRVHDGYRAALVHTRVNHGSVSLVGGIGDADTGGVHEPILNQDYVIDYEAGVLLQIGRLAGRWGCDTTDKVCTADPTTNWLLSPGHGFSDTNEVQFWTTGVFPSGLTGATVYVRDATANSFCVALTPGGPAIALGDTGSGTLHVRRAADRPLMLASYSWLREVLAEVTAATAQLRPDDTEVDVAQVAFWIPDAQIDQFRLYENFGYLIGRFQASSENYRQFIRGVFQLYLLGPTLQRIESALNVICALPVIRDDGEILVSYEPAGSIMDDPDHIRITTQRLDGSAAQYLFPVGTPIRDDVTAYVPGTSATISFLAFEPLTALFRVIDWTVDALWWDTIIVPQALMPGETTYRRTTSPLVYENTIGQIDDPHVGDPGLFIGADDDGNIPSWAPGDPTPAKRHKMVNIVVDKYIKRNLFYVYFDASLSVLFPFDFIMDLRDLVLIAKPGYTMVYVEPADHFVDTLQLGEQPLTFDGDVLLESGYISKPDNVYFDPGRPLLIGGQWDIGDSFRHEGSLLEQGLLTADGVTVPAPVTLLHDHLTLQRIVCPGAPVLEGTDYIVDYVTGVVTPITVWPAGVYTIDFSYWTVTPAASADPALGDTPYMIGGQELWFGNLGERLHSDPAIPVLAEQPVQIRVMT